MLKQDARPAVFLDSLEEGAVIPGHKPVVRGKILLLARQRAWGEDSLAVGQRKSADASWLGGQSDVLNQQVYSFALKTITQLLLLEI